MKFRTFVLISLLFKVCMFNAQNLILEDSLCALSQINLPVFSNEIYPRWNLDKKQTNLINKAIVNLGSNTYDMKVIKEGDNWFGFYTNRDLKKIYRVSFGNSLSNTPTVVDLGDIDGKVTSGHGIDIILSNNIYYGVVTNWSALQPTLLKFENGLGQLPTVLTNKNIPDIVFCSSVDLTIKGDSILAFFNSFSTKKITVVKFAKDFSDASLSKVEFLNNSIQPVVQDILVRNDTVILINGQLNGTVGVSIFNKNTLVNSSVMQVNQSFGNAWGVKIVGYEPDSILSFLNCSNNGFIYFNEVNLKTKTLVNFQQLDVKENGTFNSPIGFDYVRESGTGLEYLIIHNNKDKSTYVYEIKNNVSNWKQVGYTSFNASTNAYVYIKDSVFVYPKIEDLSVDYSSYCTTDTITFSANTSSKFIKSYDWTSTYFDTTTIAGKFKYKFSTADLVKVKLKLHDVCGRTDSSTATIQLTSPQNIKEKIDYSDTLCTQKDAYFYNNTSTVYDSIIHYDWIVKDKQLNALFQVSNQRLDYRFLQSDTFFISLSNIGQSGCLSDTTFAIKPLVGPKATFDFLNTCLYDSLSVFENSQDAQISNLTWFLNDFEFSSEDTIKILNDSLNTKKITLKTYNDVGCESITNQSIAISPNPMADFDSTYFCSDQSKQILNRSTIEDFTALNQSWYVNDTLVSTQRNPVINLGTGVNKNLKLVVSSNQNCKDSLQKTVTILENPQADFSFATPCLGEKVELQDASTNNSGTIISRKWTIDQAVLNGINPSYVLPDTGKYPVVLEVSNTFLCKDSKTDTIQINELPMVFFTYDNACVGKEMTFYNQSSAKNEVISSARWSFIGLGSILTGDTVSFTYRNSNTNLVQLEVTTENGCKNSFIQSLSAKPSATSSFTIDNDFGPPTLTITPKNNSQNAASYLWMDQLGNELSTESEPTLSFSEYGTFELKLIAESIDFCRDTSSVSLIVGDFINQIFVSTLLKITTDNQTSFSIIVSNNGNQLLEYLDLSIDFGGILTQKQIIPVAIAPGQSKTINMPIELDSKFLNSLPYLCISSQNEDVIVSENTCIILEDNLKNLGIYPSPAQDELTLDIFTPEAQEISIEFHNVLGETVLKHTVETSKSGKNSITLSLRDLTKDIYFISITSGDEVIIEKILKN